MKKLILAFAALVALSVMPAMAQQKGAPSYIAVESNSGKILFSSNAEKERPISSLAQVATALVALDWVERTKVELNRIITVPQEAYAITMGNPMNLRPGDRITLRDALYSTLLGADNVSSLTIANFVGRDLSARRGGGSPISLFVREMNNLAAAIGMKKTHFVAPHGLESPDSASTSCAVDLALLGMYATQRPAFCFIVKQPSRRIGVETLSSGTQLYDVTNTNALLAQPGVDGIKTAKSRISGPCILLSATRNAYVRQNPQTSKDMIYPQRLVIVVLGTEDRYKLSKSLITHSWKSWERWINSGAPALDHKEFLQLPTAQQPTK